MKPWGALSLIVIAGLIVVGCERGPGAILSEQEESAFRRGKQCLREGRPDEALHAFQSVIERRQAAPESHLEAGLLYLNRFNEPILAIYHFNEYLRTSGNTEQAERVKQLILTAKKEFARSLPAGPFGSEVDSLDMKELLDKARVENTALKVEIQKAKEEIEHYKAADQARLALASQGPGPNGSGGLGVSGETKPKAKAEAATQVAAPSAGAAPKATTGGKQYTVQEGDTLSIIAKKFYGASSRWKEIYEAHKTALPNPRNLKLGQVLTIP